MKTKATLRSEADARQAARAKRTVQDQLARLDGRPGNSERERARLEKQA
jgi:hypothetical protein